jgi:uncharacterized membrane protein YgdD (TMEM256/DUF423 family)
MGVLYPALASAAVLAWFGPFANHALKMRVEKNYREMWGAASLSLLPAAIFLLIVASGEPSMLTRNFLLIPAGALIGACVFAYLGYFAADLRADPARSPGKDQPKMEETIVAQGGPNINTWNQSGGTNTINVGPIKLPFETQIGDELVRRLPAGKPIRLQSVGSSTDQAVADQYQQFLQSKGFKVDRMMIGVMAPPPAGKITIRDAGDTVFVIIAPSAN